ncbi:MAG: glycosyl hydrolase family 18 protein, partial [Rhodothermales bacterium]
MKKGYVLGIVCLLASLVGPGLGHAQQLQVMSWVPPYSISEAQVAAQADFGTCNAADGLTRVGLQFWTPNTDGTIKYANHEWYTPTDSDVTWWRNWCDANGISCMLTIYNNTGSWDWSLAQAAFGANRATFVNALVTEMDRLNLDGIDIDLEGVGSFDGDRAAFDQFIHDLWIELDARNKLLTVDSFHYIWNAPNQNWWSDWLGEVDNIHAMGYEDLYEGGTSYHQYSFQQNAGYAAGYPGSAVLMGMPSYLASWGTSSGRGTTAQAHVQEVRYDLAEPTGIAIWDLQLSLWQDSDLWCEIAALKNAGGPPPPAAASNLAATVYSNSRIDLAWADNASDEDGFRIQHSTDGTTGWSTVATLGSNATTYSHTGLADGTLHFYRVVAYNTNGDAGPSNVSSATTFSVPRTIQFSGRTWIVKSAESSVVGPGPNYFSDKGPDVWVDESDRLHMRIVNRDGKWFSSEVITEEPLGYGAYTFTLASRIDQIDPNAVLGLFTWDTGAPEYNYREIDIEFSKWGNASDPTNSQYVVQPWDTPGNLVRFTTALDADFSTHTFDWQQNSVQFSSNQGHGDPLGGEIFSWDYTGDDVPPEGTNSGNARINLWLTNGQPPTDGQDIEVIIESFTYDRAAAPIVDHVASTQSTTWGSVTGSVDDTRQNGGGFESIREVETNGNPRKRTSRLLKTFTFPVRSGLPATFFANAWATPSSDGDTFAFSYSTDGSSFTPMFDVVGTSDDDVYQSYVLGSIPTSTMWVRVEDTDRSAGNRTLDEIHIDHLFVRTELSTEPPPAAPLLSATPAGPDRINLSWSDVSNELGYSIERSDDGGVTFSEIGSSPADATAFSDTGLPAATSFAYRVSSFNSGGSTASNVASATTDAAPPPGGLHLADLSGEGSTGKRWKSTVIPLVHGVAHNPESGAAVSGEWSDGRSGSCTTDGSGLCTISKNWKSSVTSVTFTVTDISKSGLTYDSGANEVSETVIVVQGSVGKGDVTMEVPEALTLRPSYPNPFNPATVVEFGMPRADHVSVVVYSIIGVEVARLIDNEVDDGWHRVTFDASELSSGTYIVVVRSSAAEISRPIL